MCMLHVKLSFKKTQCACFLYTASQQTEIDRLHDILEEQRSEIGKLNHMVDRLEMHPTGNST